MVTLPACRACKLGLLQQVQELLDEGQSVNLATPGAQLTPLHIASKHGKVDVVRLLLQQQQPRVNVEAMTSDVQVSRV